MVIAKRHRPVKIKPRSKAAMRGGEGEGYNRVLEAQKRSRPAVPHRGA